MTKEAGDQSVNQKWRDTGWRVPESKPDALYREIQLHRGMQAIFNIGVPEGYKWQFDRDRQAFLSALPELFPVQVISDPDNFFPQITINRPVTSQNPLRAEMTLQFRNRPIWTYNPKLYSIRRSYLGSLSGVYEGLEFDADHLVEEVTSRPPVEVKIASYDQESKSPETIERPQVYRVSGAISQFVDSWMNEAFTAIPAKNLPRRGKFAEGTLFFGFEPYELQPDGTEIPALRVYIEVKPAQYFPFEISPPVGDICTLITAPSVNVPVQLIINSNTDSYSMVTNNQLPVYGEQMFINF